MLTIGFATGNQTKRMKTKYSKNSIIVAIISIPDIINATRAISTSNEKKLTQWDKV
jgi:hypothetical protein